MKRLDKIPKKYKILVKEKLEEISQKIRSSRESQHFSQERLAEMLDISIETLKAIEQGKRYPSLQMLFHICFVLGIEIKFLTN